MLVRRLRGIVGTACIWGVALSAIGTAFFVGVSVGPLHHFVEEFGPWRWAMLVGTVAVRNFLLGSVAGAGFAMLVAGAERRRTLDTLSQWRVAGWGFMAAAVPMAIAALMSSMSIGAATLAAGTAASGLLGAGLGVGMIRLARRGVSSLPADSATSVV